MAEKNININELKGVANAELGSTINQVFNKIYKIPKSLRWGLSITLICSLGYFFYSLIQRDDILKSNKKQELVLYSLEKKIESLAIYGDKEKFLKVYFGDDWKKVLKNPKTYNNLKIKLLEFKSDTQKLIDEKNKLKKKIKSQRLNNSVQKMIDKAFNELRFGDVRDLLDNFIALNKNIENDLLKAHYQKALSYMEEFKYDKAKKEFEMYIPIGIKSSAILFDYALMYFYRGEYDKSIKISKKSLEISIENFGEKSLETADNYNAIGRIYTYTGENIKAIEFFNKALNIGRLLDGEESISISSSYNNLGYAWANQKEYDKALDYYNKALNIRINLLGEKNEAVATIYNNIGALWLEKGNNENADLFFKKALDIRLTIFTKDNPSIAESYNSLATIASENGNNEDALKLYKKSLEINHKFFGDNHPHIVTTYANLTLVYYEMSTELIIKKNYEEAIKVLNNGLKIVEDKSLLKASFYSKLSRIYFLKKNYKKSYFFIKKALEIEESILSSNHPFLIETKMGLKMIKKKL